MHLHLHNLQCCSLSCKGAPCEAPKLSHSHVNAEHSAKCLSFWQYLNIGPLSNPPVEVLHYSRELGLLRHHLRMSHIA